MKKILLAGLIATSALAASPALAALQCGNDASGFNQWVQDFKRSAPSNGINPSVVDRAFANVSYNRNTIRADRGQKSFKLSFDEFMKKRGGQAIISRGKSMKASNAGLFASIERRFGVPAGPVIAIWGMETGFGTQRGNQNMLSSIATLAYDCRRPEFFTDQLYAALKLIDRGTLTGATRGSMHGEVGQTQFMPKSILNYGIGNLEVAANALTSTANFLKAHGWKAGAGYQPGEPNFAAIEAWNAAGVYQKAIALMGRQIDEGGGAAASR